MRIELVPPDSHVDLGAVIALGDKNRGRLGHLPHAVYREAAHEQRLLVALSGNDVVGYALFRLPRDEVSLTHLCVAQEVRGGSISQALVDAISERHKARLGIRAKCRDDYGLNRTWSRLGFRARASAVGRGVDRAAMTVWWKDHSHTDLFSEYEQPVELRAAIDLNILCDLADPVGRGHRSDFLLADALNGRLQLMVTSGMHAEIAGLSADRRRSLLLAADPFPVVNADPAEAAALQDRVLAEMRLAVPQFPRTPQDLSDVVQIVHAAAAGLRVFLTWDDGLIAKLGPIMAEITGMKVMAPEYVVVHLDRLSDEEAFLGTSMDGSGFRRTRADGDVEAILDVFLAQSSGERRRDLKARVRGLSQQGHIVELVDDDDGPAALFCAVIEDEILKVPLLRLANHRMADTLARHLLWMFRRQGRESGARMVQVTEPHLTPRLSQAADFESMIHADDQWYAPIIDVCGSAAQVTEAANEALRGSRLSAAPLLSQGLTRHLATRLELAWWPAKILDSDLPCYAIPIQVPFAQELFGYPGALTSRDTQLSLGREHAYFHSSRRSGLTAPARVLWLATGEQQGTAHFFGVSTLDSLVVDTPPQLFAALSYYGVFDLSAITAAARGNDTAEALRLSNTELFTTPVSRRRYERHRARLDGPTGFYSAKKISPELFAAIYIEGTHRKHDRDKPDGLN